MENGLVKELFYSFIPDVVETFQEWEKNINNHFKKGNIETVIFEYHRMQNVVDETFTILTEIDTNESYDLVLKEIMNKKLTPQDFASILELQLDFMNEKNLFRLCNNPNKCMIVYDDYGLNTYLYHEELDVQKYHDGEVINCDYSENQKTRWLQIKHEEKDIIVPFIDRELLTNNELFLASVKDNQYLLITEQQKNKMSDKGFDVLTVKLKNNVLKM